MRHLRGSSRRNYVRMPWGQVHLRAAGAADAPVLLMLHQSPLSSATFEAVLGPLADRGVRAIALDTPGFGMSDAPPEPWSIQEYAAAVWQVADELGIDEATFLGQHTGAVIAWEAAIQRPAAVNGVILQGLPLYDDSEREHKKTSYAPGYVPKADGSHFLVIWERIRGLYPDLPVDETDRQVLEYLCVGPDYAPAYRAVFGYHVDAHALTDHRIALLHGDRDLVHRLTPQVRAALPWATLELVPGTDFAPDEYPEEFAQAAAGCTHDFARRTDEPQEAS